MSAVMPFSRSLLSYAGIALILAICVVYAWFRSAQGFPLAHSMTDEGYHIVAAHRLALGDLAIVNDDKSKVTQFSSLSKYIYVVWPDIAWRQVRFLSIIFHMVCFVPIIVVLSRFSSPLYAVLLAAAVCFPTVRMWTFSYDTLGGNLSVAGLGFWLLSIISSRKSFQIGWAVVAGLCMAMANLAHPSLTTLIFLTFGITLAYLLRYGRKVMGKPVFLSALTATLAAIFLSIALRAVLLPGEVWQGAPKPEIRESVHSATGQESEVFDKLAGIEEKSLQEDMGVRFSLWSAIVRKYPNMVVNGIRSQKERGLVEIQSIYGKLWKPILCWAGLIILSGFVLRRSTPGPLWYWLFASTVLGGGVCGMLYYPFYFFNAQWGSMHYQALCLAYASLLIFAVFSAFHLKRLFTETQKWHVIAFLGLAWALVHMGSHSISSTVTVLKGIHGLTPILLIGGVAVYRWVAKHGKGWRMTPLYAGSLLFFLCGLQLYWGQCAGGGSGETFAATFQQGKLAGIRAHPNTVKHLADLLAYLKGRVKPGDFLLCYYHISPVNYLTDTRPAVNNSWFWPKYGADHRQKLLDDMISSGRVPEYAVRGAVSPLYPSLASAPGEIAAPLKAGYFMPFPWLQPINAFVEANYVLIQSIGPYEVWKRSTKPLRPARNFRRLDVNLNHGEDSESLPMQVLKMEGKFTAGKVGDFALLCPAKGQSGGNSSLLMGCPLPLSAVRGKETFVLINARPFSGSKCMIRLLEVLPRGAKRQAALTIIPMEPYEDHHVSLRVSSEAQQVLFLIEFAPGKGNRCFKFKPPTYFVADP